jgi:hypothetical protein
MLGAAGAITIIAFLSVEAALMDRRPFSGRSPAETALALQQFLLLRAAPLYLVAILVEQKKRDEGSLRESEALNRGIINSLTSRVAILDRSGCIIATNEAWRKSAVLGGVPTAGTKVGVNYLEVCRRAARTGDPFSVEVLAALESVLQCKEPASPLVRTSLVTVSQIGSKFCTSFLSRNQSRSASSDPRDGSVPPRKNSGSARRKLLRRNDLSTLPNESRSFCSVPKIP